MMGTKLMPKTIDELQTILEAGDVEGCIKFFADATEAERRLLASTAEAWLREIRRPEEPDPPRLKLQNQAGRVAVIAACSLSMLKSLRWRILPVDEKSIAALAGRQSKWVEDFAIFMLEGHIYEWFDSRQWLSVRAMMKAGLCSKPRHDQYFLKMLHGCTNLGQYVNPNILEGLRAEPDLLEDVWRLFEIEGGGEYSLSTVDKYKKQPIERWDFAVCALSKEGVLPRERLLDASLDALDRGFAQFRAGWFSAFHELLEPTFEERLSRLERYLRLLASPIPPTVSFALAALESIDTQKPLNGAQLIEGLRPVMLARSKGTVKAAFKLLDTVAGRGPKLASKVAACAADALAHESSDVQSAALKLIEMHSERCDPQLVEAMTRAQDLIAASLRERFTQLLKKHMPAGAVGVSAKQSSTDVYDPAQPGSRPPVAKRDIRAFEKRAARLPEEWRRVAGVDRALAALKRNSHDLSACSFDGTEFPRLDPDRSIRPIAAFDELIDAALAAIENSELFDENERVLDGISRLCDQRPDDFDKRIGPLRKRVHQHLKSGYPVPFGGYDPLGDLLGVLALWLTGECGNTKITRKETGGATLIFTYAGESHRYILPNKAITEHAFSARAVALAKRVVKGQAQPLLSAPTHAGGWIDPIGLAQRVRILDGAVTAPELEQVLALLRLAPERRAAALPLLAGLKGEFVEALRYALGDMRARVGKSAWLWVAAARARSPWTDDVLVARKFPELGPDAGAAAQPKIAVIKTKDGYTSVRVMPTPSYPRKVDPRLMTVLMWRPREYERSSAAKIHARQSAWPLARESLFALGALDLLGNLDWYEAEWGNRTHLEPLLDPDVPLRPMALFLLAVGLAAKQPGEHGLATDAAIAAITDGRLDGEGLGQVMAELIGKRVISAARWAKSLTVVAGNSPLHAEVVRTAIARSLRGEPKNYPKDLHALVELLKELVAETKTVVDDEARAFLSKIAGSGKLGAAAKAILAFVPTDAADRLATIQRAVVEQRLLRVERWVSRAK